MNITPHCSEVSVQHRGVQLRADDPGAGLHRDGQAAGGRGLGRGRRGSRAEVEGCDGRAENAQRQRASDGAMIFWSERAWLLIF